MENVKSLPRVLMVAENNLNLIFHRSVIAKPLIKVSSVSFCPRTAFIKITL